MALNVDVAVRTVVATLVGRGGVVPGNAFAPFVEIFCLKSARNVMRSFERCSGLTGRKLSVRVTARKHGDAQRPHEDLKSFIDVVHNLFCTAKICN